MSKYESILFTMRKTVTTYWTIRKKMTATTTTTFFGGLQATIPRAATIPVTGNMSRASK